MAHTLFWIIIGIIVFDFVLDKFLDYLNYSNISNSIPEGLEGVYNEDKYRKSQQYEKVKIGFSLISSLFSFTLIILMLTLGGFGFLDEFVRTISSNEYIRMLLFFGILGLASDILSLPFQIYSTFVIEQRFGFNKTTVLVFITDKLKSWVIGALIGGGLLLFINWAWIEAGQLFWPIVLGGISGFMIFMAMFYTRLIVPLFNKQVPLEEGSLREAITRFAEKSAFRINNIFVINGSKRSTKANAYFSGLGPKKRIVLYDTLIEELSEDEIVAVLAHEVGHNKLKHVITGLVLSLFQTALLVWLLSVAIGRPELSIALGASDASFYMGLIAFGLLFSPVSTVIGIFSNMISRKHEYQADAFAASYGYGKSLVSGLIKLTSANLSNLNPHWLYVFIEYSHPTLLQRKKALEVRKDY